MPVNIANITTLTRARLYQGQPGTSSTTLVGAIAANTDLKITEILLCNITTTSATVTVSISPSGGGAGAGTRLLWAFPVAGNETVVVPLGTFLTTGDQLLAFQNTSGAITVTVSGESYA